MRADSSYAITRAFFLYCSHLPPPQRALSASGRLTAASPPLPLAAAAEAALAICPLCPEAYNLLAMFKAASLQEALAFFEAGIDAGKRMAGPGVLDSVTSHKDGRTMWKWAPLRGLYRCTYGAANTLRKMKTKGASARSWSPARWTVRSHRLVVGRAARL